MVTLPSFLSCPLQKASASITCSLNNMKWFMCYQRKSAAVPWVFHQWVLHEITANQGLQIRLVRYISLSNHFYKGKSVKHLRDSVWQIHVLSWIPAQAPEQLLCPSVTSSRLLWADVDDFGSACEGEDSGVFETGPGADQDHKHPAAQYQNGSESVFGCRSRRLRWRKCMNGRWVLSSLTEEQSLPRARW